MAFQNREYPASRGVQNGIGYSPGKSSKHGSTGLELPEPVISQFKGRKDQNSPPLTLEGPELIILLVGIHPKVTIVIDGLIRTDGESVSTPWNTWLTLQTDCWGYSSQTEVKMTLENLPNLSTLKPATTRNLSRVL